jgi:hypothetical protein
MSLTPRPLLQRMQLCAIAGMVSIDESRGGAPLGLCGDDGKLTRGLRPWLLSGAAPRLRALPALTRYVIQVAITCILLCAWERGEGRMQSREMPSNGKGGGARARSLPYAIVDCVSFPAGFAERNCGGMRRALGGG